MDEGMQELVGQAVGADQLPALPEVWVLSPQLDTPQLREALEAQCEPGEELWLVTDSATVKQVRARHLLCVTSRRLLIVDKQATILVSVRASAFTVANPFPAEMVVTRRDSSTRDRRLNVSLSPQGAVMVRERVDSLLFGTRPSVTPTTIRLATNDGYRLERCFYLGGHGIPLHQDTQCTLIFNSGKVSVTAPYGGVLAEFPTAALTSVEFGGPGRWTKGGRFMGGGFGLVGAAEGMLIATALNALTTRSGVTTIVRLEAAESMTAFFRHEVHTPDQLQIHLSWLISAVKAGAQRQLAQPTSVAAVPGAEDLAGQLEKLGDLKAQGILSEEEFSAAKARLLGL